MYLDLTGRVLASLWALNYGRAMKRAWLLAGIILSGCQPLEAPTGVSSPPANAASAKNAGPLRVVSLDYCADQYVLKMVPRTRIRALSQDAQKPFSYMREDAAGLPRVSGSAEDVILLRPDLVVRSYGGGPGAAAFFERAGISVLNVGWANDIASVKKTILAMADGLGAADIGAEIITDMDQRLAALPALDHRPSALYMTPSGVTSGRKSLVNEVLETAGYDNFLTKSGWHSLPLERLAYEAPDVIAAAFFDSQPLETDRWSAMRHPIARAQLSRRPVAALSGASMSCAGWWIIDAVEALSAAQSQTRQPGREASQ